MQINELSPVSLPLTGCAGCGSFIGKLLNQHPDDLRTIEFVPFSALRLDNRGHRAAGDVVG